MIKINIFALGLAVRIILLLGSCILVGTIFLDQNWIFTQIVLFNAIVLITIELYRYFSITNLELTKLMESLKYDEYNVSLSHKKIGKNYSHLLEVMEDIKEKAKEKSEQLNQQLFLFEKVLRKTEIAVFVINEQKEIIIQTKGVSNILELPNLKVIKDLEEILPGIYDKIINSNDDSKFIYEIANKDVISLNSSLMFHVQKLIYNSESFDIITVMRDSNHHSGNDFETWINFSKIISHEILNSISPIISLTSTLQTKLDKIEGNIQTTESMRKALKIIQDRCNSLQIYSEKYRTLQRLPEPKKEVLKWSNIINKSLELNKEQLINCNINYKVSGESLEDVFKADSWQMDQIFSNLILNSIQSLNHKKSSNKEIEINVSAKSLYYIVTYTDNGVGIHKDIRANVFTPFFTTRESGSGIGLSVIKQILWKHNAEIFLQDVDEGASFLMKFPKIN